MSKSLYVNEAAYVKGKLSESGGTEYGLINYDQDRSSNFSGLTLVNKDYVTSSVTGVSSLSSALSSEISVRLSVDTSISTAISNSDDWATHLATNQLLYYNGTTISGTTNLFSSLSSALSSEISIRTSGDISLKFDLYTSTFFVISSFPAALIFPELIIR